MPRLIHATPKYRHHRSSGQAIVVVHGKTHYLGRYGSVRRKAAYDPVIAEWLVKGRSPSPQPKEAELTISELVVAYWQFAHSHYLKNGTPTAEQDCIKAAIRPLRRMYGRLPAVKFGPLSLKAVRQRMVDS